MLFDCKKEIVRFVLLGAGVAFLLITGLLGGIGGATRAVVALPKDFLTGGAGGF